MTSITDVRELTTPALVLLLYKYKRSPEPRSEISKINSATKVKITKVRKKVVGNPHEG